MSNLNLRNGLLFVFACVAITGCFEGCTPSKCKADVPFPQPGSCPQPGVPDNQFGGKCTSDWTCWVNGGQCVSGTCLPCGGDGEVCCGPDNVCSGACVYNPNGPNACSGSCGTLGKACCPDNYCEGSVCDDNSQMCVVDESGACNGPIPYVITFVNKQYRCADFFFDVKSTDDTAALACGEAQLQAQGAKTADYESALNVAPTHYPLCQTPEDFGPSQPVSVKALSEEDALSCANYIWPDSSSITLGECP